MASSQLSLLELDSAASVSEWLKGQGFDDKTQKILDGFSASDLKSLSKEDARELLGVAVGIRLYNRLAPSPVVVNEPRSGSKVRPPSRPQSAPIDDQNNDNDEDDDNNTNHIRTPSNTLGSRSTSYNNLSEPASATQTTQQNTPSNSLVQTSSPASTAAVPVLSPLQMSAVARLAAYYPTQTRLNVHTDANKQLLSCCSASLASLHASVATTQSNHGISGTLAWLTRAFQWGSARCEYVCECIMAASVLDCGSGGALAVRLLRQCFETRGPNATIAVLGVAFILRHSNQEYHRWNELWKKKELGRDKDARWLDNSGVHLHQAVGLVTLRTGEMNVWNYGTWIRASLNLHAKAAPLAIRVDAFDDLDEEFVDTVDDVASAFRKSARPKVKSVVYGGFQLNVGEWTSLMPASTPISGLPPAIRLSEGTGFGSVAITENPINTANLALVPSTARASMITPSHSLSKSLVTPPVFTSMSPAPHVYSSGCAMNDDNPSPGVGLARCIRTRFPCAHITGVDFSVESAGLTEPSLDDCLVIDAWNISKAASHYIDVEQLLTSERHAFWLPASDVEVHMLSHQADKHHCVADVRDRILCPSVSALEAILKPCVGAAEILDFKVPLFMLVEDDTSVQEVYAWSLSQAYPLYVKGVHFGAQLCHSWSAVASAVYYLKKDLRQPVYIQRAESGFQKGLAFAAVNGELTGSLMLTKTVTTMLEKGWSGHLAPVPNELQEKLKVFVRNTKWTGGGEIEYMESLDGSRWLIDFNPRFPAWIGASVLAHVNLPGALLQHVLNQRDGSVPLPIDVSVNSRLAECYYTRTVVELISNRCAPVITAGPDAGTHLPLGGAPRQHASRFAVAAGLVHEDGGDHGHGSSESKKKKLNRAKDDGLWCQPTSIVGATFSARTPRLALYDEFKASLTKCVSTTKTITELSPFCSSSINAMSDPAILYADLDRICPRLEEIAKLRTPCYVLSQSGVDSCVASCRNALQLACTKANVPHCSISASIKTNPHHEVLKRAWAGGCHAEGISMAEIRAALFAGFPMTECVLNGPGKFVDARDPELLAATEKYFSDPAERKPLRAIFADSLSDLEHLLTLIHDPNHWIKARIVGVRFAPSHSTLFSRFGVRQDAVSIRVAANLLSKLPAHVDIGIHFHFAASALGLGGWHSHVSSLLNVVRELQLLLGPSRPIKVLDLGGGWPSRMLDDPATVNVLTSVLTKAMSLFPQLREVYLEPGKSLTERAGGLVSTVTALREVAMSQLPAMDSTSVTLPYPQAPSLRAAVVDGCFCDVGAIVAHPHPMLHLDNESSEWKMLSVGKDEVLGRICMEWDKLAIGVKLPDHVKVGDKMLLAFTGAYDMSQSFGFGYGKLPDINTDIVWMP